MPCCFVVVSGGRGPERLVGYDAQQKRRSFGLRLLSLSSSSNTSMADLTGKMGHGCGLYFSHGMKRVGEIGRERGLDRVFGSHEVPSGTGLGGCPPFRTKRERMGRPAAFATRERWSGPGGDRVAVEGAEERASWDRSYGEGASTCRESPPKRSLEGPPPSVEMSAIGWATRAVLRATVQPRTKSDETRP